MIPARTTDGSRTADRRVRTFITSLASWADRPMWMSNVPSSRSRRFSTASRVRSRRSVRPGHGRPSSSCNSISGRASAANARRCGARVRRISPIRRRSATMLGQDVVLRAAAQRVLVELVDLALDRFDEVEVAGQDLVGDRGHEPGRIERAETRLALGRGVEPFERLDRSVMDSDHPVVPGDDVDGATDGLRVVSGFSRAAPSPGGRGGRDRGTG